MSGGSALIVSEYALDARAYNEDYESVMWATCTLRKWLNGEFYDTAFNEEEKGLIALTKVKNADNPKYGTDGGKDTEDRVFLLSLGEAERYFEDDEDRRAFPTEYAIAAQIMHRPAVAIDQGLREPASRQGGKRWLRLHTAH